MAGRNDRLIVQMPPRHGKSELSSVHFPAQYLGVFPERHVISVGADDELAKGFSGRARDILREHGPSLFRTALSKAHQSASHWQTDQGGGLKAAGVGGTIVGSGADLLLIDDYIRNIEAALSETQRQKIYQWYLTTAKTRLSPKGAIVIIATRWHPHDLIGCLLRDSKYSGEKWRVVKFPAIDDAGKALWPERWGIEKLEAIRAGYYASGYPWQWEALYQQNPPEILDSEFPPEYFADHIWYDEEPVDHHLNVVTLDPSLGKTDKSDYSAFVRVLKGHDGVYYIDADIARRPSATIVQDGIERFKQWKPYAFGCETNQFQQLLKDEFDMQLERENSPVRVFGIHNHVHKVTRIRALTPLLASGRLRFKRNSPGVNLLVEQLRGFPSHKFDDGPDGLEMGVRFCDELLSGVVDEQENADFERILA